jgi:hypothetical protein
MKVETYEDIMKRQPDFIDWNHKWWRLSSFDNLINKRWLKGKIAVFLHIHKDEPLPLLILVNDKQQILDTSLHELFY